MKNPFQNKFKLAKKIDKFCLILLVIALVLSLLSHKQPHEYFGIIGGVVAFLTAIGDVAKKYFISLANRHRIDDLIDNSFGEKLGESRTEEYYTNDTTINGIDKLAINSFESCFYTKRILEDSILSTWGCAIFTLLIFIVIACLGLNTIFCIILQASLPISLLINAFQSQRLISYLNNIESDYRKIYSNTNNLCRIAELMLCILKYENVMSSHKVLLSEKSYNTLNENLKKEWESLKKEYNLIG